VEETLKLINEVTGGNAEVVENGAKLEEFVTDDKSRIANKFGDFFYWY